MIKNLLRTIPVVWLLILFAGCHVPDSSQKSAGSGTNTTYQPKEYIQLPDWSMNATIYQVNTRQYTPQGAFAAFEKHLPRLKKMGVDVLWFMPIHLTGQKNRKGTRSAHP